MVCVQGFAPSAASTIQDIAREKAEAVSIMKGKARKYAISLAQGRLFSAYLAAATASESQRLKERIANSFKALRNKYGMKNFTVVDRSGGEFIHVGSDGDPRKKTNIRSSPAKPNDADHTAPNVASVVGEDNVTYVSPVIHNGEKEFVLSIEQDLSAYEKVLALGLAKSFHIVIIDGKGNIISDNHGSGNAGKKALIAGLSFEALRQEINGNLEEGTGVVSSNGQTFNVSYQTVDDWTVVAIEPSNSPSACLRIGANACQ